MLESVRLIEYNKDVVANMYTIMEMAMKYITAKQAAEKSGISQRRVQIYCVSGRIKDVFKLDEKVPKVCT